MQEQSADYKQTLEYLFSRLPMFSRVGKQAIKKDLDNIRALCESLKNPQEHFRSIHIAGTNGKGSTSHMLSAILQEAGFKVGLYTSPHLIDFRERIRINGEPISAEWVVSFVQNNKQLIEQIEPSFFEITVAMAFQAFNDAAVDIAVIETGLGGRLDSTNIINPILSIITNISYDHKDVLGHTLKEIAREKAGIIKEKIPVLIGEQDEETTNVFFETAVLKQSPVYYAESFWDLVRVKQDTTHQYLKAIRKSPLEMHDLQTDLLGAYQLNNIRTVLSAADLLQATAGIYIPVETSLTALSKVKTLSGLRGRWDCLSTQPTIIADVAHNVAGLSEVMNQWKQVNAATKHIIVGFVKDKEVKEALSLFPKDAIYHFCQADIPRALPVEELAIITNEIGLQGTVHRSVEAAIINATRRMQPNDALLITGSFFIVGEALEYIEQLKGQPATSDMH